MIQFQNQHFAIFQSALYKTTSTVLHTEDCILVVDPTWLPSEVAEIRQYVDAIKQNQPLYLLFTHSDWDHVLGYGAFQDAMVIASDAFQKVENKEEILQQIRDFDSQYYIDRSYPLIYPEVDILIVEDGQVLQIGDTKLTFYLANGHTKDGIFMIVDQLGLWIAGDCLSDVEFPFIYDGTKAYEETLLKARSILQNDHIQYLIPGHGNWTDCKEEMHKRINDSCHYIKELVNAIQLGADSQFLIEGYQYLKGLKTCHQENIELVLKEMDVGKKM